MKYRPTVIKVHTLETWQLALKQKLKKIEENCLGIDDREIKTKTV